MSAGGEAPKAGRGSSWCVRAAGCHFLLPSSPGFTFVCPLSLSQFVLIVSVVERPLGAEAPGSGLDS